MGFLLGAYGKLMAGKRLRALQARMMSVQSRLRRATRDIEQMEKYWTRVEKDNKNAMSMAMQYANIGIQQSLNSSVFAEIAGKISADKVSSCGIDLAALKNGDISQLAKLGADSGLYTEMLTNSRTAATQTQQLLQAAMQQQMAMQENMLEAQKEAQLQPLKDLEDDLMLEQEMLKTQIQLAEQDQKACEEMEKSGVKSFAPQYTGQG